MVMSFCFGLYLMSSKKNFSGIADMVAVASMLASFPVIPVRGKLDAQKTTRGTSPLSLASRMLIRQRFQKKRRTITWKKWCAVNGHIQQVSGHMLDVGCPGLALC